MGKMSDVQHRPLERSDLDPAHAFALEAYSRQAVDAKIEVEAKPGVSQSYREKVENFVAQIPPHLQKIARNAGITIEINATPEQIPAYVREGHARRHNELEKTTGHLPAFYYASAKKLIFIEHPYLTSGEQQLQNKFDDFEGQMSSHGVQSYGKAKEFDPKKWSYAAFERTAWHEFGHALDLAAFGSYSLASDKFDKAFESSVKKMTPQEKAYYYYFVKEDRNTIKGHELDAAHQELFAELFALSRCPKSQWSVNNGARMLFLFSDVVDAMRAEKPALFRV